MMIRIGLIDFASGVGDKDAKKEQNNKKRGPSGVLRPHGLVDTPTENGGHGQPRKSCLIENHRADFIHIRAGCKRLLCA